VPPVYVNGVMVDAAEATVSVFDHGLVTGDGVFESVAIRNGRPFALSRHLDRLQASAAAIGLSLPPVEELERAARFVLEEARCPSGKIRITVTGGPAGLGSARGKAGPTLIVACEAAAPPVGLAVVVVAPWPKNERGALAGAKTISYAENVVALAYANEHGATEALWRNAAGNVCEGTGTNIFLGIGGDLFTPPLSAGCLAGVTRGLVLELTGAAERDLQGDRLAEVDEAFLTSTTRGVQPIGRLDGRELPNAPGPLTLKAAEAFGELAARGLD
jgi:branched-chain amino acid aminotransferase